MARRDGWSRRLRPVGAAAAVAAGLCGCAGTWDELTSRDFHFSALFVNDDPMTVLRQSTDGDARAKAMRALKEPRTSGGPETQQDEVVQLLTTAAVSDPQPLCRLAAIQTLGTFQDPRAVSALIAAYESAAKLSPETSVAVQCKALSALGETKQPTAVSFLVHVSQSNASAESSERERQQQRDIRLTSVRALGNFKDSTPASTAVAQVLATEKDVALRDRARESYAAITGRDAPETALVPSAPGAPAGRAPVQLTGGTAGR
jgi:HEAT repeat protein